MGLLDFLNLEDEMPYEMKFFVWARKIEDEVERLENYGTEDEIMEFLGKCADAREKYLDPDDLTEIEEYYTKKIHYNTFEKYGVADPIYDLAFGKD